MKNILFLACIIGLMSISVAYAKCDGGTEITNSVGTIFCRSNVKMNWWSAYSWCKANGREMATIYDLCPNWDGTEKYKCSAIGNRELWTSTAYSDYKGIKLGADGYPYWDARNFSPTYHAACK